MVGGVKRKILSEIILWSSLQVTSFESRTTQGLTPVTRARGWEAPTGALRPSTVKAPVLTDEVAEPTRS